MLDNTTNPADFKKAKTIASRIVARWRAAGKCTCEALWQAFRDVTERSGGLTPERIAPGLRGIRCIPNPLVKMMIAVVLAEWLDAAASYERNAAGVPKPMVAWAQSKAIVSVGHCVNWLREHKEELKRNKLSLVTDGGQIVLALAKEKAA